MEEKFDDIDHLILMFLRGKASEKQYQALKSWSNSSAENKLAFESIEKIWLKKHILPDSKTENKIRDQIWALTTQKKPSKRVLVKSYSTRLWWVPMLR